LSQEFGEVYDPSGHRIDAWTRRKASL